MFQIKLETFRVVILVYVDELVILRSKKHGVKWTKDKLRFIFKPTDLEEIKYYL